MHHAEFLKQKQRLYNALDKTHPGLPQELGRMSTANVRRYLNDVFGSDVANGPPDECLRQFADLAERQAGIPSN